MASSAPANKIQNFFRPVSSSSASVCAAESSDSEPDLVEQSPDPSSAAVTPSTPASGASKRSLSTSTTTSSPKKKLKRQEGDNTPLSDRVKQSQFRYSLPNVVGTMPYFEANSAVGKLECKCCDVMIQNYKHSLEKHLSSAKHKEKFADYVGKLEKQSYHDSSGTTTVKRQLHVTAEGQVVDINNVPVFKPKREVLVSDFIKMLAVACIPFYKVEKMRDFLGKHVNGGGTIPRRQRLSELVKIEADLMFESMRDKFRSLPDYSITLVVDETPDAQSRSVVNFIFNISFVPYLAHTIYLSGSINASKLNELFVLVIQRYFGGNGASLEFDAFEKGKKKLIAVATDNAEYCVAGNRLFSAHLSHTIHMRCYSPGGQGAVQIGRYEASKASAAGCEQFL